MPTAYIRKLNGGINSAKNKNTGYRRKMIILKSYDIAVTIIIPKDWKSQITVFRVYYL